MSTNTQDPVPTDNVRDLGKSDRVSNFTIQEVRNAIPAHCFEVNTLRSFSYLAQDLVLLGVTAYLAKFIPLVPNTYLRAALWTLYTFTQGLFAVGPWVLAHECGHGTFSRNKFIGDFTGWVIHSALLVPYFSFKITHRKHHATVGNLDKDNTFVPKTREQYMSRRRAWHQRLFDDFDMHTKAITELSDDTPLRSLYTLIAQQICGWPMYLLINFAGEPHREHTAWYKKSHFYFGSDSILFDPKGRKLVLLTDLGLAIVWTGVYLAAQRYGWWNVIVMYLIPLLWLNHWTITIAFLHHTDLTLPRYRDRVWSFARGATATIDRDFGFIGRRIFHNIADTHVLHHLISTIPHYHAEEATRAMRKVMGPHYRSDNDTGYLTALWRVQKDCKFVEEREGQAGSGVLFFRNMHSRKFDSTTQPMRFEG